jgi:hypothetical protein
MQSQREYDPIKGELYLAGERVPPGIYREIGNRREVCFEVEDILPATLDGRVACYELVEFIENRQAREQPLLASRN